MTLPACDIPAVFTYFLQVNQLKNITALPSLHLSRFFQRLYYPGVLAHVGP